MKWVIKEQLRPGYVFAEIFSPMKRKVCLPSLKLTAKAPENWPSQKETIVFQPSISRCELLVSGRVIPQNVWNLVSSSPCKPLETDGADNGFAFALYKIPFTGKSQFCGK